MNYTVIARRWRPKRFEDVIGQPHIVTTIKNSIKFNRIAHAYLFTGPRGVGKTSLARIIAKAMNCIGGPREEPCGECENCKAIDSGSFVDVIEIDAASTRGIDDIRELTETVRYMPMKGAYKLYILDEAHMLTPQARDAFLKTLEEPPGNSIFILATTEPQKIPYTIMSRCQRFDFRRMSERDIVEQMKKICQAENIGYDENAFKYIAVEADGSMRDGESLLDQVIAYSGDHITENDVINVIGIVEKDILFAIMKSILDENLKQGLEIIEKALNEGNDAYQIYERLVYFVRNMMILKVYDSVPPFLYMDEDEYKRKRELIREIEYYELQNMLNYLLNAEGMFRGFFPKITLEMIYINLFNISKLRDMEKIIDAMGQAERQETRGVAEIAKQHEKSDEGRHEIHDESYREEVHGYKQQDKRLEEPPARPSSQPDLDGFIQVIKKKMPLIGSILQENEIKVEGKNVIFLLNKNFNFIKNDNAMKEDLKEHLKMFFGVEMGVLFKTAGEKKSSLDEYVREAEKLF